MKTEINHAAKTCKDSANEVEPRPNGDKINTDYKVVDWCIQKIQDTNSVIFREGKNWYISTYNCVITELYNNYRT
ncbi:MAG: DUF3781 domain-containing protein [Prevotellaceae bacterium]|jgi:hypothetical protein|nr:DUF3781 domain-containing protein [Prevotellaceae bacterium]